MATVTYIFDDDSETTADQPLDLTPYPTGDEIEPTPAPASYDRFRTAEEMLCRPMLAVAAALAMWMAFGAFCAHMAGRL